jgi:hypothetical protein
MVNVTMGKKRFLAIAAIAGLCALAIAVPAFAFSYVHGNDYGVSDSKNGVIEVCLTVDGTAVGEAKWTELVFVPADSPTAETVLEQGIHSGESQQGDDAIHDYSYETVADWIAEGDATVEVYPAESQNPGTQTTQDGEGTDVTNDLGSTVLQRYDQVVVTLR